VKAPFSWPNNSDSIKSRGIETHQSDRRPRITIGGRFGSGTGCLGRDQGPFDEITGTGALGCGLAGDECEAGRRPYVEDAGADVVFRQRITHADQSGFSRLPSGLRQEDVSGEDRFRERAAKARKLHRGFPEEHFRADRLRRCRIIPNFDFEPHVAPRFGPPLGDDAQDRQVGERLGRGDRFQLDVRAGRQHREIGGGPVRPLKVTDDDDFTPEAGGRAFASENFGRQIQSFRNREFFRRRTGPRQFVAQHREIGRGLGEDRGRSGPGENQIGPHPVPKFELPRRQGPGPLKGLHSLVDRGHALAHVEHDDANDAGRFVGGADVGLFDEGAGDGEPQE
jgi:hypothetical protein